MPGACLLLAWALGSAYALWVFYLAVMALKRARDAGTLSPVALRLGWPVLLVGLAIDAAVNLTVASVLFLELPRELTVTARLTRHIEQRPAHWRGRLALWITSHLLDTFDPSGLHR